MATSAQVSQVLEVLSHIRRKEPSTVREVRHARLEATEIIAEERGISKKSVADKCWRKLGISIGEFDSLVYEWLTQEGSGLADVVLRGTAQGHEIEDEFTIRVFFEGGFSGLGGEGEILRDLNRRRSASIDESLASQEFETRFDRDEFSVPDEFSRQKVRIGHQKWRERVLDNFESRCAVCGLSLRPLLEAAHLVGWSEAPAHRLNPRNGICLCVLHHRAYDRGLLAFVGREIKVSPRIGGGHPVREEYLLRYDGEKLAQPQQWDLLDV